MQKEDRAGLELTIIVHLVVLICLLLWGIGAQLHGDNSFVLDFSREEEIERKEKEDAFKEDIGRKLDKAIKEYEKAHPVRNVAVSSKLRDDRNSAAQAEALYKDAERLKNELKNGTKSDIEEDARNEAVDIRKGKTEEEHSYSGPAVLSWTLDERKALHLPIPAYRCYGSGEVTVNIVVDRQGKVLNARVNEDVSSSDGCLRSFAIRAARLSRFSISQTAPPRQGGEIVYSFVGQK